MNKNAIAAVAVVALVGIGALLVLPGLMGLGQLGSMDVVFYDKDGNAIVFAFARAGTPVDKFTVTVSYTVTATSDVTGLLVDGSIRVEVRLNTQTSGLVSTRSDPVSSDQMSKSFTIDYFLCNVIGVPTSTGKQYGWAVTVTGTLSASGDMAGETYSDDWTGSYNFVITWTAEEFTLGGSVAA